ncbi:MAG: ABC transporter substrate-binding protein [Desulfovibrio sp.]
MIRKYTYIFLCIALTLLPLTGCGNNDPISVGFAGPLTGRYAYLGVSGRNGAELAIDESNAEGGINGRMIQLITKNDRGTIEGSVNATAALIEENVIGIVGHFLSSQGVAVQDTIADWKGVIVSPTISTPLLSNKHDAFYRVMPTNRDRAEELARYSLNKLNIKSVLTVGDIDNRAYVDSFLQAFSDAFEHEGTKIIAEYHFVPKNKKQWGPFIELAKETNPDAVVMVASPKDTAILAKYLEKAGLKKQLLCSTWSFSKELIPAAGSAIEGAIFATIYNEQINYIHFIDFQRRYTERYGSPPTYAAAYAYEATFALLAGIKKANGDINNIQQEMLRLPPFTGILSPFAFSETGDVTRRTFLMTVKNGKFIETRPNLTPAVHQ